MLESSINSTIHNSNGILKVAQEQVAFVFLDFSVLNRGSSQKVVKFDGLVGSGTSFVLSGVFSEPEVDVPCEGIRIGLLLVGVQDNVRISRKELSVLFLWPGNNYKVSDQV